jgi:tetratricopeptide (TPR) repeat protein
MYETIDNYFEGRLSEAEKAAFEAQLEQDPLLADEVAFYLSAKVALKEQTLQKRHAEWTQSHPVQSLPWGWLSGAAAAIILLVMTWYFLKPTPLTLQEQANAYIEKEWSVLETNMSTDTDSLQTAIGYYNKQKYKEALPIFEQLARKDSRARTYAGFTYLQLKNYDAAIALFEQMAADPDLLDTHGKVYTALAYLQKGDSITAQRLLEEVISGNLDGKAEAEKWLEAIK